MKSRKLRLLVITLSVLLASCDNFFMYEGKIANTPQTYNNHALSRKAELTLWHTAESYETPVETLQEQVQALLQTDANTES